MTMPNDFRERLPELLDERAPRRAPADLFARFAARMETERQRPAWATVERWLPMPTRVQLYPVRRSAIMLGVILLLALALAAAFAAGQNLLAGRTIIVAADGSGDVTTIAEGVARAGDGDTILIRPGTYTESVTVTHDVEIRGDGGVWSIVVSAPDVGPVTTAGTAGGRSTDEQRYAILLDDTDAIVTNLTFQGEPSAVVAIGGAPTIEGNQFDGVGIEQPYEAEEGRNAIAVVGGSRAIIRGNRIIDSGPIASFDRSEPLIELNELIDGASIAGGFGSAAVIRGNSLRQANWGIESRGDTAPLIEENIIVDVGFPIRAEGGATIIRANHIQHPSASDTGIQYDDGAGVIEGNAVNGYARGVATTRFDGTISGNTIDSGFEGLNLTDSTGTVSGNRIVALFTGINLSGSSPAILDNRIEGSVTGVTIAGEGSAPTFSRNELCGTSTSVAVSDGAAMPDPGGLVDCPEASALPSFDASP